MKSITKTLLIFATMYVLACGFYATIEIINLIFKQ